MNIGILGVGMIGTTLAQRLAAAGHSVAIANSRGPETIDPEALRDGARAVHNTAVAEGVDVLIVSVPLNRMADVAPFVQSAPDSAVIIDTSNYYPSRDGKIEALENGQVESLWVEERLGRPFIKAWNAIGMQSFAEKGTPAGTADRIAIPVAGDDPRGKDIAVSLVNDTGFDAFDTGTLAESWRQQPGTPVYCVDRTADELASLLHRAAKERSPLRRDLVQAVMAERSEVEPLDFGDYMVGLNRAIY